jgi:hypothetical protein
MRFVPRKLRYAMMLVSLSAVVAACGGGGSSGGGAAGEGTSAGALPSGRGYAVLTWEAPVTREDGNCLQELAAYQISYGLSPGVYNKTETISVSEMSASETGRSTDCGSIKSYSYLVENLGSASWYFAVKAVDSSGNVSDYSNEAIKTIQ